MVSGSMLGGGQRKLATDVTPSTSSGLTLAEIFARIPPGDEPTQTSQSFIRRRSVRPRPG
jgi:hypothetical protein